MYFLGLPMDWRSTAAVPCKLPRIVLPAVHTGARSIPYHHIPSHHIPSPSEPLRPTAPRPSGITITIPISPHPAHADPPQPNSSHTIPTQPIAPHCPTQPTPTMFEIPQHGSCM